MPTASAARAALCLVVLAGAALPATGGAAHADPAPPDLARLSARLQVLTASAQDLARALDETAARDGGLGAARDRLAADRAGAQRRLDVRAREVYMSGQPDPLERWRNALADPGLQLVARRGEQAALTLDRGLVTVLRERTAAVAVLERRERQRRQVLLVQAGQVLREQDVARELLATARRELARRELARQAAARGATARQELARQAAQSPPAQGPLLSPAAQGPAAQLAADERALDAVSAGVTHALAGGRPDPAAAAQAPVLALLERAGSGLPEGYVRTGQVLTGTASWYGPGFLGLPTASGAAYDPERLTCAHKELPLGTVVHVRSAGREVNCLVNDRGPYVGARILDMSRAGSRALGYDGLAQVTVEVLQPAAGRLP